MDLMDIKRELLNLTLDQLRTFVIVYEQGSPRAASAVMSRDQSSVTKQLDNLNTHFQNLCGERLAKDQGRGKDYAFTGTGDMVAEITRQMLAEWSDRFEQRRRQVGKRLVIATTTFTLKILAKVWTELVSTVDERIDLVVQQIRTADFWDRLEDKSVDAVVGGLIAEHGQPTKLEKYDFLEISRDSLCVVTNLEDHYLGNNAISVDDLKRHILILPDAGVIIEAVQRWFGPGYKEELKLGPTIIDVHYGIELLRAGIIRGLMVATSHVGERLCTENPIGSDGNQVSSPIRMLQMADDFKPLDLVVGLCARKGERNKYSDVTNNHPLTTLWNIVEKHSKKT